MGFAGTPYLLVSNGTLTDTLHLEPRVRRGIPAEQDLVPLNHDNLMAFGNAISMLTSLSRDPAGNIIVVHTDVTVEPGPPPSGMRISDRDIYVSSISPDGTRQCVDTLLPHSGEAKIVLFGPELQVVDQVARSAISVSTVIRRYTVDPSTCDGSVLRRSGP